MYYKLHEIVDDLYDSIYDPSLSLGPGPFFIGECTFAQANKIMLEDDRTYTPIMALPKDAEKDVYSIWVTGDPSMIHTTLRSEFNMGLKFPSCDGENWREMLQDVRDLLYMGGIVRCPALAREGGELQGHSFCAGRTLKEPDFQFWTGYKVSEELGHRLFAVGEVAYLNEDLKTFVLEAMLWTQRTSSESGSPIPVREPPNFLGIKVEDKPHYLANPDLKWGFAIFVLYGAEDPAPAKLYLLNLSDVWLEEAREDLKPIKDLSIEHTEKVEIPYTFFCPILALSHNWDGHAHALTLESLLDTTRYAQARQDRDHPDRLDELYKKASKEQESSH